MKFDPSLPKDGVNVTPTHPVREALVLVAGVIAVASALAFAIAVSVDLVAPRIPPLWEERLFSGWFEPDEDDGAFAEQEVALAELLARVERHWPESPYAFRIVVWDEPMPNAVALPGGTIAVTLGLLDGVESENELAFVLGHELGHFANRDHLRGLGRAIGFSSALVVLGVAGGGSAAQLASLAGDLTQRGFSREQESEADRFGLELVAAEYGHTAGATDLFDHLPQPDGEMDRTLSGYLSTHPIHDDRIDALRAAALRAGWPLNGQRSDLASVLLEVASGDADSGGAEVGEETAGGGE